MSNKYMHFILNCACNLYSYYKNSNTFCEIHLLNKFIILNLIRGWKWHTNVTPSKYRRRQMITNLWMLLSMTHTFVDVVQILTKYSNTFKTIQYDIRFLRAKWFVSDKNEKSCICNFQMVLHVCYGISS